MAARPARRLCRSGRARARLTGAYGSVRAVRQSADARATFQALQAHELNGFLVEASALREAECDEALGDYVPALAVYERLAAVKTTAPEEVLARHTARALEALTALKTARAIVPEGAPSAHAGRRDANNGASSGPTVEDEDEAARRFAKASVS